MPGRRPEARKAGGSPSLHDKGARASLEKSPVNVAVGELLKGLRTDSEQDTQAVANAFALSAAYVRAIEAGQRALPAYAAAGLVEQFGMKWSAASAMVAIASFMDLARAGNKYDADKLMVLSRRLRECRPEYREFLDCVEAAVSARDTAERSSSIERTARLTASLDRCVNAPEGERRGDGALSPPTLSPVLEDLAELLMDRLALFPPHVNTLAIQRWESKNNHRILSLRGYVSEGDTLTTSASAFDWKVMRKGRSPSIRVLVPNTSTEDVVQIEKGFLKVLSKSIRVGSERRTLSDRVQVRTAGEVLPECKDALWFDFATRSRAAIGVPHSEGQKAFPNAWLYELVSEAHDSRLPRWIGFLMDKDPVNGFAVAMNREHVAEWLALFRRVWPEEPSKRTTSRTGRRART